MAGATAGAAGNNALSILIESFKALNASPAGNGGTPPVGGTQNTIIDWLDSAVNAGISNLNTIGQGIGFPPVPLIQPSGIGNVPLPPTRPAGAGPSYTTNYAQIISNLRAVYSSSCNVPPLGETIPDDNPRFHNYQLTRQSYLDVFIVGLIDKGFDATIATEFATGMYGIESHYGANPTIDTCSGCNTNCNSHGYCGPFQCGDSYMDEFYTKWPGIKDTGDKMNWLQQIVAVCNGAWAGYETLRAAFPNYTLTAFDIYMTHQQGRGGASWLYQMDPTMKIKDVAATIKRDLSKTILSTWYDQYGYGQGLFTTDDPLSKFFDVQRTEFQKSVVGIGSGNCGGEFAVEFFAGSG